MTTQLHTPRPWRRIIAKLALGTLVLPSIFVGSTFVVPENVQAQENSSRIESNQLEAGSLEWGVRYSIRNYLENFGHTNGYVSAFEPATYRTGDDGAKFPVVDGWIDPVTDEAELSFGGRLDMYGFGDHWLHFKNVRLSVAEGQASITVDLIESFSSAEPVDDLVLAEFDFDTTDIIEEVNGKIVIASDEGVFPAEVGENHLPRQDGEATYGPGNDHTDRFVLSLEVAEEPTPEETSPSPSPEPTETATPDPGPSITPDPSETTSETPLPPEPTQNTEPSDTTPAPPTDKSDPWGESSATNRYGASLTVNPAYSLADEGQVLHMEGTGFPTTGADGTSFGGFYVLFGWVDPDSGDDWGPGHGGIAGQTYAYSKDIEPQGTYQSMVNFPGNTTTPGFATLDDNGNFSTDLPIMSSRFESQQGIDIDCYTMQCGVMLIGAHGKVQPEGEIFVPVYFTDDAEDIVGDAPVALGNAAPVANPNMVNTGQNPGLAVNGGLPGQSSGTEWRTTLFAGVLIISLGLFGAAVLFNRSRATRSEYQR